MSGEKFFGKGRDFFFLQCESNQRGRDAGFMTSPTLPPLSQKEAQKSNSPVAAAAARRKKRKNLGRKLEIVFIFVSWHERIRKKSPSSSFKVQGKIWEETVYL